MPGSVPKSMVIVLELVHEHEEESEPLNFKYLLQENVVAEPDELIATIPL